MDGDGQAGQASDRCKCADSFRKNASPTTYGLTIYHKSTHEHIHTFGHDLLAVLPDLPNQCTHCSTVSTMCTFNIDCLHLSHSFCPLLSAWQRLARKSSLALTSRERKKSRIIRSKSCPSVSLCRFALLLFVCAFVLFSC